MKNLTRVALFGLAVSLVPVSYAFAQDDDTAAEEEVLSVDEAHALIKDMEGAADATDAKIPTESQVPFYDLLGRQVAYRENAKEFRGMIEERRDSFQAPQEEKLIAYRKLLDKIYAAEMADFQQNLKDQADEDTADESPVDEDRMAKAENKDYDDIEPKIADEDMSASDEHDGGLKEEPIPGNVEEEGVNKKVVTSDDAPDFDPSDL